MLDDPDAEVRAMARDEMTVQEERLAALEAELRRLLVPRDPNDERDVILEIRAGTGGDEASLFAADLFRMYARYAERRRWRGRAAVHQREFLGRVQGGHRRGGRATAPTRA